MSGIELLVIGFICGMLFSMGLGLSVKSVFDRAPVKKAEEEPAKIEIGAVYPSSDGNPWGPKARVLDLQRGFVLYKIQAHGVENDPEWTRDEETFRHLYRVKERLS